MNNKPQLYASMNRGFAIGSAYALALMVIAEAA